MKTITITLMVAVMILASVSVSSAEDLILAALSYREGMRENANPEKWTASVEFFKGSAVDKKMSRENSEKSGFKSFYDAGLGEETARFAFAGVLSAGVIHPSGHMMEGAKYGIPVQIDYRNFREIFDLNKNKAEETDVNAAGFQTQDKVARAVNIPELYLFNAGYKILFPFLVNMSVKEVSYKDGDIGAIKAKSGNKYTKELITASAVADLVRGFLPKATWDLSFSTFDDNAPFGQGTPGLVFTVFINENLVPVWSR